MLGKNKTNYHYLQSIVTFLPDLYDLIQISKSNSPEIYIRGKYSKALEKEGGDTLVKNMILFLKKKFNLKDNFRIIVKKNIPLGAGLGGGSADAAAVARLIIRMFNLKIRNQEIIKQFSQIGADIPACFFSCNQKVEGIGDKLSKLRLLNKTVWVVLIKPRVFFKTKEVFENHVKPFSKKLIFNYNFENLLKDMNFLDNDLQEAAMKLSTSYSKLLINLPRKNAITIPRMTGSGSTIFILCRSQKSANLYLNSIENVTKGCWKKISRIFL